MQQKNRKNQQDIRSDNKSIQTYNHRNYSDQYKIDLPYNKQLQFTKNRDYKQNLNPIFQLLQTKPTYPYDNIKTSKYYKNKPSDFYPQEQTFYGQNMKNNSQSYNKKSQQKYKYLDSKDINQAQNDILKFDKNIKYERTNKNDGSKRQQQLLQNQNNFNNLKNNQDKIKYYKQRSRILSQNIQKKPKKQHVFSFGDPFYENNKAIKINSNQNQKRKQLLQQQLQVNQNFQEQRIINFNDKSKAKANKTPEHQNSQRYQQYRQNQSRKFIQNLKEQIFQIKHNVKQSHQTIKILTKGIEMHKQKNLLKQKQLYLLQKQRKKSFQKQNNLKNQLEQLKKQTEEIQTKYHQNNKILKSNKNKLTKQQKWLDQQTKQVSIIQQKYQTLIKIIQDLQSQQSNRNQFWKQLQNQASNNQELKGYIWELETKMDQLLGQNKVLQQEIQTLEVHQNQLENLQNKFKEETQKILQSLSIVEGQIQEKQEFISQQQQFDTMIRQLQLQIGQISSKKIILDQQIHQINYQIDQKKRNIRHIERSLRQKKQIEFRQKNSILQRYQNQRYSDSIKFNSNSNSNIIERPRQYQKVFVRSKVEKDLNFAPQKKNTLLSTIKQQSKNTSAYQSPKQDTTSQQKQQSQIYNLELDSNQVSRTQILKPHNFQNSEHKLKKYLVVESQEDGGNLKSYNFLKEKNSQQFFIQRENKPSIEHRLIEIEKQSSHNHKSLQLSPQKRPYKSIKRQFQPNLKQRDRKSFSQKNKKQLQRKGTQSSGVQNCSDQIFDTLISRYQQIKSNSYFDQEWKDKL